MYSVVCQNNAVTAGCYCDVVDPGFGEFCVMPGLNHLNICKPCSRASLLYQKTLQFVRRTLPMSRDPAAPAGTMSHVENFEEYPMVELFL